MRLTNFIYNRSSDDHLKAFIILAFFFFLLFFLLLLLLSFSLFFLFNVFTARLFLLCCTEHFFSSTEVCFASRLEYTRYIQQIRDITFKKRLPSNLQDGHQLRL